MSRKIDFATLDLSPANVDNLPSEDNVPNSRINLVKSALYCTDPSRTVHSAADETDVNKMVAGLTPFTQSTRAPFFIDETVFPATLEDHVNNIDAAYDAFMELPPTIREQFDNDPRKLASALGDPAQLERLAELGLIPGDESGDAAQRPTQPGGAASPAPAGGSESKEVITP